MTLKVLAVDDSKTIRKIVTKAFIPYDCEVKEAENGIEGLAIAGREKIDLIILDITMPVMTGVEMLSKLKGQPNLKDIPVIMLTAESGKDNVMQILKMDVKDYMVKPFKGEQLIERVFKIYNLKPAKTAEAQAGTSHASRHGDMFIFTLPEKIERQQTQEIDSSFQQVLKSMSEARTEKLILDIRKPKEINMLVLRMIIAMVQHAIKSRVKMKVAGSSALATELKGFQETSDIPVYSSLDDAVAGFSA
ncbi:MAG: response regulator [Desulfatirhabdiaceae bacterium]